MNLSHNKSCINSDVDGRLRRIFASKNRQVNHSLASLSTVLCGQSQRGPSHSIKLLKNLDLFLHFLSASRHLGFEDVQAVVDLVGDARQISGLSASLIFDDSLISSLCNLTSYSFPPCNPLESSNPRIQSVVAQAICISDECPALARYIVLFNSSPVYHQRLTHAVAYMHDRARVKASLIRGFIESQPQGVRTNE